MGQSHPEEPPHLDPARLAAAFDRREPLTIGLEEEVMLLDLGTFELVPRATEVLAAVEGDPRFKAEFPASQVEILTEPTADVGEAVEALALARRDLAAAADGIARPASAGVHPFAPAAGELSDSERSARVLDRYGYVAERQQVAALQVHVAVGGAERTLTVYNALREHLPEIAALAANAPIYLGEDTGLASIRPKIAETLPRQGLPPAIPSWEWFAAELRWGARIGALPVPGMWWWELRPHPRFGTLELRVPDAQTTLADAAAVTAFVQGLVGRLSEEADSSSAPTWRIAENRWAALRAGVEGEMADLRTGELEPTRTRLRRRLAEITSACERLGTSRFLGDVERLIEANGAVRQREVMREGGPRRVAEWLAERFLEGHDDRPGSGNEAHG